MQVRSTETEKSNLVRKVRTRESTKRQVRCILMTDTVKSHQVRKVRTRESTKTSSEKYPYDRD